MSSGTLDPISQHSGYEIIVSTPFTSYDLLAILPFLLAAMIVAGVRKIKRRRSDTG